MGEIPTEHRATCWFKYLKRFVEWFEQKSGDPFTHLQLTQKNLGNLNDTLECDNELRGPNSDFANFCETFTKRDFGYCWLFVRFWVRANLSFLGPKFGPAIQWFKPDWVANKKEHSRHSQWKHFSCALFFGRAFCFWQPLVENLWLRPWNRKEIGDSNQKDTSFMMFQKGLFGKQTTQWSGGKIHSKRGWFQCCIKL